LKIEGLLLRLEKFYARLDQQLGGRLSLLVRTAMAFDQDDGPLMARSIAYYALFAIFPALLALMVIASTRLESQEVYDAILALVSEHLPMALDFVEANVEHLLKTRETVGAIALIGLIWSASGVFGAVYRAVNRAWGIPKSRLVLSEKLYGLAVMSIVGTFFLLTMGFSTGTSLLRSRLAAILVWEPLAQADARWLLGWGSTLLPAVLAVLAFVLAYRTMPRAPVQWRDVWAGGLIAGLVWETGKQLFGWYLSNATRYNVLYGSVEAVIVFLLWAYLSAQIFLLGAELTAQVSRWRQAGRPVEARPLREWMAEEPGMPAVPLHER
jgi:membrane protein